MGSSTSNRIEEFFRDILDDAGNGKVFTVIDGQVLVPALAVLLPVLTEYLASSAIGDSDGTFPLKRRLGIPLDEGKRKYFENASPA